MGNQVPVLHCRTPECTNRGRCDVAVPRIQRVVSVVSGTRLRLVPDLSKEMMMMMMLMMIIVVY
jgi:hypothetical protein